MEIPAEISLKFNVYNYVQDLCTYTFYNYVQDLCTYTLASRDFLLKCLKYNYTKTIFPMEEE